MTKTVEAIYEKGVLKLRAPLPFPENSPLPLRPPVKINLQKKIASESAASGASRPVAIGISCRPPPRSQAKCAQPA